MTVETGRESGDVAGWSRNACCFRPIAVGLSRRRGSAHLVMTVRPEGAVPVGCRVRGGLGNCWATSTTTALTVLVSVNELAASTLPLSVPAAEAVPPSSTRVVELGCFR